MPKPGQNKDQVSRFKEAARELECDESEARFNSALKKVTSANSLPEPKAKKPKKAKAK